MIQIYEQFKADRPEDSLLICISQITGIDLTQFCNGSPEDAIEVGRAALSRSGLLLNNRCDGFANTDGTYIVYDEHSGWYDIVSRTSGKLILHCSAQRPRSTPSTHQPIPVYVVVVPSGEWTHETIRQFSHITATEAGSVFNACFAMTTHTAVRAVDSVSNTYRHIHRAKGFDGVFDHPWNTFMMEDGYTLQRVTSNDTVSELTPGVYLAHDDIGPAELICVHADGAIVIHNPLIPEPYTVTSDETHFKKCGLTPLRKLGIYAIRPTIQPTIKTMDPCDPKTSETVEWIHPHIDYLPNPILRMDQNTSGHDPNPHSTGRSPTLQHARFEVRVRGKEIEMTPPPTTIVVDKSTE